LPHWWRPLPLDEHGHYYKEGSPEDPNPRLKPIEDYNPDHNPSSSALYKSEVGPDTLLWAMQVKGLGVLVFRTCLTEKSIRLAEFSKADIGPSLHI
jgi:hypothetical protein